MAKRKGSSESADEGCSAVDFAKLLKDQGLKLVYLILGEEDHLRREVLLNIRRAAFDGEEDSPSLSEHDAKHARLANILDDARTMPFLGGGRRVVLVENAGLLIEPAKASDSKTAQAARDQEVEAFFRYLERPADTATLVLITKSLDKRFKTSKRLMELCSIVQCDRPDAPALLRWVRSQATKPKFSAGAAEALIERCAGGQIGLGQLAAEVEKLLTLAHGHSEIGLDLVEMLVQESSKDGFFDLLELINKGQARKALEMVEAMVRDGAVDRDGKRIRDVDSMTTMAVGAFSYDLRNLWRMHSLTSLGRSVRDAANEMNLRWRVDELARRARVTSVKALRERHRALRAADYGAKSDTPALENLARLVVTLCQINAKESQKR